MRNYTCKGIVMYSFKLKKSVVMHVRDQSVLKSHSRVAWVWYRNYRCVAF